MSTPEQRSARASLDAARPAVARLDQNRSTEDLAADLIEVWGAVEAALRTLVGSSVLVGQPLIREARSRQLINFDQANSLAEFQAARDRVQDTSYRPTAADIDAARTAFLKLDAALVGEVTAGPVRASAPQDQRPQAVDSDVRTMSVAGAPSGPVKVVGPPPRFSPWVLGVAAVVLLVILGGGGYLLFGRGRTDSLQQGIDAYRAGQREVAVSAFNRAARDDPRAPMPHVYLARMAREVGNFTLASQELQLALQADPANATALREMGANLLAQGNYELARRFYVRAVQADPADKQALGYLGCTLMKLNRTTEATNFLNRAGQGPWSSCTPATTGSQAGQLAPAPRVIPR